MMHKQRKLITAAAALLVATAVLTPASARQQPQADSGCGRWYWGLLQHIFQDCQEQLPDWELPDWDVPDTDVPDTDTPAPEQPTDPPADDGSQEQTPQAPETVSSLEQQVAELVNRERAAYGLSPLTLSAQLSSGARLKSQDMRDNGYFDHTSPTYGTPFEMMAQLGITYATAGENIAMGYSTAEAVVEAWMNSAGHRANILSENYTQIGVGYVDGYWTQWFLG